MIDSAQMFDGTLPSTGAAVTVTRVSENVLDLLTGRDIGSGRALAIDVLVTQTFVGGTSLVVSYEVCDTVGGTYLALQSSPTYLTANLVANTGGARIFKEVISPNALNNATAGVLATPGRFVRLRYTVVGTFTAGAVMAWIAPTQDMPQYRSYPIGYSVAVTGDEV